MQSVFGITTMNTPAIVYLYISVPLLIVSLVFTMIFPVLVRRFQRLRYPHQSKHLQLPRQSFTMLGDELPDSADVPSNVDLNTRNRVSSHRNSESYAPPPPPSGSASGSIQLATLIPNKRERSRRRGERS